MSRLDSDVLSEILDRCLIQLQAGQDIESVIGEYPGYQDSLRPILEAMQAVWVSKGSDTVPIAAMARSRAKLIKAVYDLKQAPLLPWWQRHAMIPVVSVLVCFGMLFTGIASAQSLPGQALYPVKLAAEHLALALPASPATQLAREENYDVRRNGEVKALIDKQDYQMVTLTGFLTQGGSTNWLLDSKEIVIAANLLDKAAGLNGHDVTVLADLGSDGQINAESIEARVYLVVGRIRNLAPDRAQVGDIWVQIGPDTQVSGLLEAGMLVQVTVARISNDGYMAVKIVQAGLAKLETSPTTRKSTQAEETKTSEEERISEQTLEPVKTDAGEPENNPDTHEGISTQIATRTPQATFTRRPVNPENPSQTPEAENKPGDPSPSVTKTSQKEHESHSTSTPQDKEDDHHRSTPTPSNHHD